MHCREAEKLISLYAGADLPAEEARLVADHLRSCAACRDLLAQFETSRVWLQEQAVVSIDDSFLAEIRAGVRQEIARPDRWTSWFEWPALLLRPRLALASLATLLLIATSIWVMTRQETAAPTPEVVRQNDRPEETTPPPEVKIARVRPAKTRARAVKRAIPPPVKSEEMVAGNESAPEMTRIEFQTADPTIRIIWLAPGKE